MFLPWVFTGSGVSTTPQRVWLAAPWTVTVQGPKRTTSGVRESRKPRTNDRPPLPSPSIPGGTRGDCKLQEDPVGERKLGEYPYPPVPVKRTTPRSSNNKRADEGTTRNKLS